MEMMIFDFSHNLSAHFCEIFFNRESKRSTQAKMLLNTRLWVNGEMSRTFNVKLVMSS
jgi:hypothetical protein